MQSCVGRRPVDDRAATRLGKPDKSRGGQAAVAAVFWLAGVALLAAPFLRDPATSDPEGDDPTRTSELDRPFAEELARVEAELGIPLADALASEVAARFGEDAEDRLLADLLDHARLEAGKRGYDRHCVGCHGEIGDGAGPAARHLEPRPRNFRKGVFKFTSTESGKPPLRSDIFQTITRGLSGSSMPPFHLVSQEIRYDIVEYVRSLAIQGRFEELFLELAADDEELPDADEVAEIVYDAWAPESLRVVFPPISEIAFDDDSVARGREVYLASGGANCSACHGDGGEGDGPSAREFADHWGYPIVPRDLTSGVFRAGATSADLYRSIATGVNGTPMPSFEGSIPPEDIWAMVHFIQTLGGAR